MYYRVAIQVNTQSPWKWQSTALRSLNMLLQWLHFYRAFPRERLRVFVSPLPEALDEQLVRENQGLASASVPVAQFLQEMMIAQRGNEQTAPPTAESRSSLYGSSSTLLEKRREELERGAGGDHDHSYRFMLPASLPQVLDWVKLLARVQQGDLSSDSGTV